MIENLPSKLPLVLSNFGIYGSIGQIYDGPIITEIEFQLEEGSKFNQVENIIKDISRELGISGVRVSEIPNLTYIRFEIPQQQSQIVPFPPILYSQEFIKTTSALPICLGVDMRGTPIIKDLSKMPHLLVAGTTGSGKSVGLNSFILSLINKKTPQELQLILIDPKRIEFSMYNNQKYMMRPVITDMNIASICLSQLCTEMNNRYELFEKEMVRNIEEYKTKGKHLPYIVCVIDEFADLIMFDKSVEKQIQILAQKSRASGIHLIIATQRPSVDILTGSIKANLPNRISYKVASPTDSLTILNTTGAENLLGRGDSLFLESNGNLTRILGAYVSNEDIINILSPYKCTPQECKQLAEYQEQMQEEISTEKSDKEPKKIGIFNKITSLWQRIGKRNQTKIIKGVTSFALTVLGNNSSRRRKG